MADKLKQEIADTLYDFIEKWGYNVSYEIHRIDNLNFQIRVKPANPNSGPRYFLVKVSEQI
jgi:hypothetical protein